MLSFTGSLRIFVALEACDMRKGFEGLVQSVKQIVFYVASAGLALLFPRYRRR